MTEEINEVYEKVFEITCSNRILSSNDPTINAIFKEVKKALGNDLASRIEHLDRNKAIMIVCGDNHLTKGIISYIWYTHPPKLIKSGIGYNARRVSLRHKDYLRWTETQVMSDLMDWGISFHEVALGSFRYEWDYIQFFQNLKGAYWKALKYLLDKTKTYKDILLEKHKQELQIIEQNYKQFPQIDYKKCLEEAKNNILENGRMLIVSTDKVGTLPKNLSEQFEIVEPNLEPEKQIKTKGIPQTTPGIKDTPKTEINSELFLENNHHLKILDNNNCIKLTENLAELVRFMARKDQENEGLDLTDILCFHYGNDVRNKMTLSKKDRQPFDKEKKGINDRCEEALKRDLIKSLGGKKFALDFKVILPKNFKKHFQ